MKKRPAKKTTRKRQATKKAARANGTSKRKKIPRLAKPPTRRQAAPATRTVEESDPNRLHGDDFREPDDHHAPTYEG